MISLNVIDEKNIPKWVVIISIILSVLTILVFFLAAIDTYNSYENIKKNIKEIETNYTNSKTEFIKLNVHRVTSYIDFKRENSISEVKQNIKSNIDDTYHLMLNLYQQNAHYENIKIQEIIKSALSHINYSQNKYYWIYKSDGTLILNPSVISEEFKKESQDIIKKLIDIALKNENGDFYTYNWHKLNKKDLYPKISFAKYIKELDWVIGTGFYIDEVENQTKNEILNWLSKDQLSIGKDYIFITQLLNKNGGDEFAKILFLPSKPELINTLISDKTPDIKGNFYRQKYLKDLMDKGESYTEYWYKRVETNKIGQKFAYRAIYKPYNWIIGSGFYYDDLNDVLQNNMKEQKNLISGFIKKIIFMLVIILIVVFVLIKISRNIKNVFLNYKQEVQEKEKKLIALNESLEEKVKSRTENLNEINKYLEDKVHHELKKRIEHEQILIHQSKMAAMGEMLSAIAHQWRQPLNTIALTIQDLKDAHSYNELTSEYLDENVTRAMKNVNYMSTTINDFRDFFKPNRTKEKFCINKAIEDALNLLKAQFLAYGIEIVLDCEDVTVFGYKNEFTQVILNILNNAKDSVLKQQDSSKKDLKGEVSISIKKYEDKIYISICDNGTGISDNIRNSIFDPYFTTKFESQGTGIGLYMSRMIVERNMSGTIVANNNTNNIGACFLITLPISNDTNEESV